MKNEYIVTHRLAGKTGKNAHAEAKDALEDHLHRLCKHADVVHDTHARPSRRQRRFARLNAPEEWVAEQSRGLHPDLVLERRVRFAPHILGHLPLAGRHPVSEVAIRSSDVTLVVTVRGGGVPLVGAEASLMYMDGDGKRQMHPQVATDENGQAALCYPSDGKALLVGAYPAHGYWSACASEPSDSVVLDCSPLPDTGPLGWWHHAMGVTRFRDDAGRGIRIGLLGTGVTPHPCLSHVQRLDGKDDISSHGTHVCGIIGARPVEPGQFAGFAPGAEILTRRVFEFEDGTLVSPDQGDLAHAIEALSVDDDPANHVDLINMSLGGSHSLGLHDAVTHALQNGTVCVCSAGNSSGAVEYPAAWPQTIGVSALGQFGWGSENSVTTKMTPDPTTQSDRFGSDDLFLAGFSSFGPEVACAAPGAGIISTVPPRDGATAPYAVMDGTSLSCPAVTGLLARLLAKSESFRDLPRNASRTAVAWETFRRHCANVGLDTKFQGAGLPGTQPTSRMPTRPSKPSKRESPRKRPKPGITPE